MFRAAYRSSSGALTVFSASGLHTHVVTGRSEVWVEFHWVPNQNWLRPVNKCICKPEAANTVKAPDDEWYAARNMLSFNERWINKIHYKVSSCWLFLLRITRATNTHLEYVILSAFPLQQWLRERPSALRYAYFDCIVNPDTRDGWLISHSGHFSVGK
jgi:hypothetical protein